MKIGIVISLPITLKKNYDRMNRFKTGVLPYLLALAVVAALLMMEPHLSGTILICTVALSMIIVGGIRPMHFWNWQSLVLLQSLALCCICLFQRDMDTSRPESSLGLTHSPIVRAAHGRPVNP